jgi:hypothetical protein
MVKSGDRRSGKGPHLSKGLHLSKGSVFAGVVGLLTFVALIAAPFWLIKTGQFVNKQHSEAQFDSANHPGQVVHDGDMSFVVSTPRCGVTKIGRLAPEHGQFCVLELTVGNEGAQPTNFDAVSQRAMGSRGGFYIPDPQADAVSNGASDTLPGPPNDPTIQAQDEATLSPAVAPPLAPGTSRNVQIVYDIPTSITLTQIDLHSTEYTAGAVVLF